MITKLIRSFLPTSTLKSRIFKNLIVFTMLPFVLIAVIICINTYQDITKKYTDHVRERINESSNFINETLGKYIDKSSSIITNQYLITHLQKDYGDDLEQMIYFMDNINAMISEPFSSHIKSPYIIHTSNQSLYEGKFVHVTEGTSTNEWLVKAASAPATEILWEQQLTLKNSQRYVTFYRNIVDFNISVGILEVNIPYTVLEAIINNSGFQEKALIFLVNDQGDVLQFTNYSKVMVNNVHDITPEHFVMQSETLKNGHTLTVALPRKEIYKLTLTTLLLLSVFFFVYVALMLLASHFTSRKITQSLQSFITQIKQKDNLLLNEDLIEIEGDDEVAIIKQKFKTLISRMNEIYQHNNALEIELLQSRINPHLLYNSLSVIKWTASWNKDQKTIDIVNALTKYYRTALNKGNQIIQISAELEMIKEYVKINVHSHSCDYRLEVELEEGIAEYYTFKHLLQPIVENAILHGLNGKEEDARITIKGYWKQTDIVFEVSDNGRGMEQETIVNLMNDTYSASASFGGYGMRNVRRRLQAYYGNSYIIQIQSGIGEGTKVLVPIAALNEQELTDRKKSGTASL
ncbi:histidine kinase [Paenibacillus sp. MBLB4367]|uniref:sensor histidine kinase n=1 Tax=Paenibacillus sp. MBLB4367 TaxID=3384767 RepID=UPI003908141D